VFTESDTSPVKPPLKTPAGSTDCALGWARGRSSRSICKVLPHTALCANDDTTCVHREREREREREEREREEREREEKRERERERERERDGWDGRKK
jgi:hypothetical protein